MALISPIFPRLLVQSGYNKHIRLIFFPFFIYLFGVSDDDLCCLLFYRGRYHHQVKEMMLTVGSVQLICSLLWLRSCWKKAKAPQTLPIMLSKGTIVRIIWLGRRSSKNMSITISLVNPSSLTKQQTLPRQSPLVRTLATFLIVR